MDEFGPRPLSIEPITTAKTTSYKPKPSSRIPRGCIAAQSLYKDTYVPYTNLTRDAAVERKSCLSKVLFSSKEPTCSTTTYQEMVKPKTVKLYDQGTKPRIKPADHIVFPDEPFQNLSSYRESYKKHHNIKKPELGAPDILPAEIFPMNAPFYGDSSYKMYYVPLGSEFIPEIAEEPDSYPLWTDSPVPYVTTTQEAFPYKICKRTPPIQKSSRTLKYRGEHSLETTQRAAFIDHGSKSFMPHQKYLSTKSHIFNEFDSYYDEDYLKFSRVDQECGVKKENVGNNKVGGGGSQRKNHAPQTLANILSFPTPERRRKTEDDEEYDMSYPTDIYAGTDVPLSRRNNMIGIL